MKTNRNYSEQFLIAAEQNVKERDYWLDKLSGEPSKSTFFHDFKKTGTNRDEGDAPYNIESLEFMITGQSFEKLSGISSGSDYTLHVVLVAFLVVLLNKYTGSKDILLGTPIYKQDIEGEFVNKVLALRNRVDDNMTFKTLLLQVKRTIIEAVENQGYPIEILIEKLNLSFDTNDFPLFDVAILLENIHDKRYIHHTCPNMIFSFSRREKFVAGVLEYNAYCYKKSTVERIADYFTHLIVPLLANENSKVSGIELLPEEMKKQLLVDFNDTKTDYPKDKTIQDIFESRTRQFPGKIALVYHNEHLTYANLNKRANGLARLLRDRGVKQDSIVGTIIEPSLEMVTGILAILKAGAAYLPIDVNYPGNRVVSLLEDCRVPVILLKTGSLKNLTFSDLLDLQRIDQRGQRPVVTGPRPQMTDLDQLPIPDRSLVNYEKYNRHIGISMVKNNISMQATRGCPYNCAYCHKIWPKHHISRSAENIFQEVKLYYDMGFKNFTFVDDIFNLDIKNSKRFFELVIKNDLDVHFHFPAGVRGDILTKEYIDLMVRAGTTSIALALETASPRLQKLIGKNLNIERLRENARYFTEKYPHVILELFTIHGFPTETEEDALLTLEFIKSLKWLHFPYFHILKIFPKTDMESLALKNGISRESILNSENLAYHELPETLPFEKSFTLKCQSEFFNGYFLSKERLLTVLPYQMKGLTEAELVQKYDSYLPIEVNCFNDLLEFAGIRREQLQGAKFLGRDTDPLPCIHEKIRKYFPLHETSSHPLRVLLLDLSQLFTGENHMLYDVVEAPLGLMYLMTCINRQFGTQVEGKVAKSRIDFDNYNQLKTLIEEFKPDIIGIRTLTFYKEFFHRTTAMIANWGFDIPIIAGGPYATSDYERILKDPNVDLVVLGEGEITFGEVIREILANDKKLPGEEVLRKIRGIAFMPGKTKSMQKNGCEIVIMDTEVDSTPGTSGQNPGKINQPSDLAYIIFTSGSTGKPKGVMIEHENVVRLMFNDKYLFDFDENDNWTLFHSYCFDFSVWEIWGALLYGGKLIIIPWLVAREPKKFMEALIKERVTVLNQTPSAFYNLINFEVDPPPESMKLRYVIFGGEALSPIRLKSWQKRYPFIKFINMFGITETTVHVTYKEIGTEEIEQNISNIGKPIPTLTTYVMDHQLNLLPIGVPGELFVGGKGVGRGYLNRPQLTAEKFTRNPYKHKYGREYERLYRSGDRGRLLDNGEMEYLGRVDHQVKIRGFRVEPGEIENLLLNHEVIKDAVVLCCERKDRHSTSQNNKPNRIWDSGNKYLCAYVVPSSGNSGNETGLKIPEIRKYIGKELPDYMVPAYIVPMEKIPLTPNGKVDKKALPDPELGISTASYTAPGNKTEKQLAEIWGNILGIERQKIGIDASFFELGGHSLKATLMESRIHKEFDVKIPLAVIFRTPTIRELAGYMEKVEVDKHIPILPIAKKEFYPLSSPQKRFYTLQQIEADSVAYNVPIVLILDGKLAGEKMEKTFTKLIHRHESLRTSFHMMAEGPVQKIHDYVDFAIEYYDPGSRQQENFLNPELIRRFIRPFDLSHPPLLRVRIIEIEDKKHLFMVDIHHIITDAISMNIFIEEFTTLYGEQDLPPLRLQYKDYTQWQASEIQNELLKVQEKFWLKQFEGDIPELLLPCDFTRPLQQSFEGAQIDFVLDAVETQTLHAIAIEQNATLFMILLALFNILLSKLSGQESIIVGSAVAGRRHEDLKNIIGDFLNTLPLWNFPQGEKTFKTFLNEVKERVLDAFENQDYPFDDLVEKVVGNRHSSRTPLFDVMFGLQNIELDEAHIPGLNLKPYSGYARKISKFDLLILANEVKNIVVVNLKYKTTLFKEETIKKFITYFKKIVSSVIENPGIKLKAIEMVTEDERDRFHSIIQQDEADIHIDFNI